MLRPRWPEGMRAERLLEIEGDSIELGLNIWLCKQRYDDSSAVPHAIATCLASLLCGCDGVMRRGSCEIHIESGWLVNRNFSRELRKPADGHLRAWYPPKRSRREVQSSKPHAPGAVEQRNTTKAPSVPRFSRCRCFVSLAETGKRASELHRHSQYFCHCSQPT